LFYFTPLYYLVVSFAPLKKLTFRLFGYKGPMNFILAPDAWLRDLPLLTLDEDAYVANLATMGSNICMADKKIFVHTIKVGPRGIVGHRCIVGPGARIGEDVEASINTMVGIRTRLDPKTKLASRAGINHGVHIHENVDVGASSYIGLRAIIGKDIRVPAGANIPSGANIQRQSDLDAYVSSETVMLNKVRAEGLQRLFEEDVAPPGSGNTKTNEVA
jgi:UDP-3-O-[3-hydroxymyristoyl] glucosamine N-acyltransferase